ncbi:MAG: GTP cyclohydrolase II [Alphaproteobacteria bacterium]|nr:GTP cyclohydrolase II [Alphaproteobacteria bacterium]
MTELRRGAAVGFHGHLAAIAVDGLDQESLRALIDLAEGAADSAVSLYLSIHRAEILGLANGSRHLSWRIFADTAGGGLLPTILAYALPEGELPGQRVVKSGTIAPLDPKPDFTNEESLAVEAVMQLAIEARLLPALLVVRRPHRPPQSPCWSSELYCLTDAALHNQTLAREQPSPRVKLVSRAQIPLSHPQVPEPIPAEFLSFRPSNGGSDQIAVMIGEPNLQQPVTVRLHSSCLTGDLFGSLRCDCGEQLHAAIRRLSQSDGGVILYLPQEGRGIGISNKLRAYRLQEAGFDTLDANQQLGFDPDLRDYGTAVAILQTIGISAVRLLSNNPTKHSLLEELGMPVVERLNHSFPANPHNHSYLQTKKLRGRHDLD